MFKITFGNAPDFFSSQLPFREVTSLKRKIKPKKLFQIWLLKMSADTSNLDTVNLMTSADYCM